MKNSHEGDCTIYASRQANGGVPESGICTCGNGLQNLRDNGGDISELYSLELQKELERAQPSPLEDKTK